MRGFPVSGFSDGTDRENGRAKRSRCFWNGSSFLMTSAQRSRVAQNVSRMAALIFIRKPYDLKKDMRITLGAGHAIRSSWWPA